MSNSGVKGEGKPPRDKMRKKPERKQTQKGIYPRLGDTV